MSIGQLANGEASRSGSRSGRRHRPHLESYENERTKILLRESLAREESLVRRMEVLIEEQQKNANKLSAWHEYAVIRIANLTAREHEIMELILAGQSNKRVAAILGISRRTVENHRALIMKRTGSKSLPALARLALAAGWNGTPEPNP